MAETSPTVRTGLEDERFAAADGIARHAETGPRTRLVLRARNEIAAALAPALDVTLPSRINTAERSGARAALKLGPDEWLILAEPDVDATLAAALEAAAAGAPLSLVNISHRNAGLVLEGSGIEAVLAAGCPLPLDLEAFPVGRATRTLFAKAEIMLWRTAPERFQIEVGRSFAPYLSALLGRTIAVEAALVDLHAGQS